MRPHWEEEQMGPVIPTPQIHLQSLVMMSKFKRAKVGVLAGFVCQLDTI